MEPIKPANQLPVFDFPGIYQILNLVNGKRYVGQAQNITSRIREHRRRRNGSPSHNPYSRLYRSAKKHGWDSFEFSLLERVNDLEQLDERERFWIQELDVCDEAKGYNLCPDPSTTRGWRHCGESLEKMRLAAAGRFGEKNPFFGKKHTEATKAHLSRFASARVQSEQEKANRRAALAISGCGRPKRKVEQVDPKTGKVVRIWPSISDACRELNISDASIVGCCQGRKGRKTVGGWVWRYAGE